MIILASQSPRRKQLMQEEISSCFTIIVPEIDESLSNLEGEGPYNLWRENHINFFKKYNKDFNDDTLVVFETFELIEDLTKKH